MNAYTMTNEDKEKDLFKIISTDPYNNQSISELNNDIKEKGIIPSITFPQLSDRLVIHVRVKLMLVTWISVRPKKDYGRRLHGSFGFRYDQDRKMTNYHEVSLIISSFPAF